MKDRGRATALPSHVTAFACVRIAATAGGHNVAGTMMEVAQDEA